MRKKSSNNSKYDLITSVFLFIKRVSLEFLIFKHQLYLKWFQRNLYLLPYWYDLPIINTNSCIISSSIHTIKIYKSVNWATAEPKYCFRETLVFQTHNKHPYKIDRVCFIVVVVDVYCYNISTRIHLHNTAHPILIYILTASLPVCNLISH